MNLTQKKIVLFALNYLKSNLDAEVVSALTGVEEPDEKLIAEVEDKIHGKLTVYAVAIDHQYGTDVYAGLDQGDVSDRAFDYVKYWWGLEKETKTETIPDNKMDAISMYFELVERESATSLSLVVDLE